MLRRWISNAVNAALILLLPLSGAPRRLVHPSPWINFLALWIILVSQPAVRGKELRSGSPDKLSALVIFVTMTVMMVAGVVDYGYRQEWTPAPVSSAVLGGGLLLAAGLAFRLWAIRTLGRWFTSVVRTQEGQTVIRTGPYRFVRHPSYTGALAVAFGMAWVLSSPLALGLDVIVVIPAYLYRISVEEQALLAHLGEDYRAYTASTRRLIPFVY